MPTAAPECDLDAMQAAREFRSEAGHHVWRKHFQRLPADEASCFDSSKLYSHDCDSAENDARLDASKMDKAE